MTEINLQSRHDFIYQVVADAGRLANTHFQNIGNLKIESKGLQDLVSNADREVETLIRDAIHTTFPQDGIVGEEFDDKASQSGFTWVIDPIDGTANFVTGIPLWCVAVACVQNDQTKIAVIHDEIHSETFSAIKGQGSKLNGKPISVVKTSGLDKGSVGIGLSTRPKLSPTHDFLIELTGKGGLFVRHATGCIGLAYVASGRMIAFIEQHMKAWDCIAGQLLVAEAGGKVEQQSADMMIKSGGRVVASAVEVFDELVDMSDRHFGKTGT